MREFRGTAAEFSETAEMDAPEKGAWSAFAPPELDEIGMDPPERPDAGDPTGFSREPAFDKGDIRSEAEKAADHARAYGFHKAADYIARHYD